MQTNSTAASASPAAAAASPAPSARGPLASANRISFLSMCTMFERISEAKSTKSKQLSYLELLWKSMRGATAKDYFQVLRLIMPQLDTKRSAYGLKESKIARYYVELLGLSDSSPDAIRFKHWKDPSRSAVDTTAFSDAVYVMLVKRGFSSTTTGGLAVSRHTVPSHPQTGAGSANSSHSGGGGGGAPARTFNGMSVTDVNNALDALAAAVRPNDKKAILFELLRSLCALEHKWLIRIIMKEMRIHLSQNPILGAFHPNALELFNSTNDLEHVCEQCLDPKALEAMAKAAASGSRVFLMRPFKPMLASVVASDKLAILLEGEKLLVEPKYDGERILLHFDASGASSSEAHGHTSNPPVSGQTPKILYWSRNAKNSTHLYGPKFDPVVKGAINWAFADVWRRREQQSTFGSGLEGIGEERRTVGASTASSSGPSFWPGMIPVYNCVLDGELLLFDKVTRQFVDFGHNRTFARSGRGGGGEGDEAGDDEDNAGRHQGSSSSSSPSLFGGMVLKTNDGYFDGGGGTSSSRRDRGAERHHNKGSFVPFNPQQILENSNGRYCFQYQVFDVVFLNGECLCSTALEKRKDILRRIIREKADEVLLVPFTYVRSGQEIFNALDRALEQRHEGILIKVAGSHYVPAERKLKWMKIKPDHISGMADTMDLTILGAYYGTKYGSRHLSHFLLGCYVDDGEDSSTATTVVNAANEDLPSTVAVGNALGVKRERDPNDNDSANTTVRKNKAPMLPFSDRRARFHTVCKVGTGYDADELRELNAVLDGKWISLPTGSSAPPWLDGWRPAAGEVPDVYIHPKDSVVMEIFGFSMTETVKFRFGHTVRFPRCHRIRHDKDVEDATTTSELRAIVAASFSNGNHAAARARLMGGGGGGVFSGADLIPASGTGSSGHLGAGGGGTSLLASRRAGDLDALITMKEAKKRRKEKARLDGGGDDASLRAKKNMKGEGDFGSADDCSGASSRKNLVFASRTILAPRAGTVEVRTGLFSGYEICVLQSSIEVMERAALERLLASHGAQIVSNPQPTTSVILASSRGHVRVQNWISACTASPSSTTASMTYATTDVVNVSWALACVAAGELLPLVPSNTVFASPTLRAKFRQMLDPYHDEYYRDVRSIGELRETLGKVVRSGAHLGKGVMMEEMASSIATSPRVAGDGVRAVTSDGPLSVSLSSASSNDVAAPLFPSFLSSILSKAQRVEAIKRTIYAEFPSVVGGACVGDEANDAQPVVIELPSDEANGTLQRVALKRLTANTPCDATMTQASPPSLLPEPEGASKTPSLATPRLAKSVALFSPPLVAMKPRVVHGTAREAFVSVGEVYGDSITTPSQPHPSDPSVSALSYLAGRHSHRSTTCTCTPTTVRRSTAAFVTSDQHRELPAPPAVVSVSVDTHSLAMLVAAVREGLASVR